jgi:Uma2 family endonuclease
MAMNDVLLEEPAVTAPNGEITPDDLLAMPDGDRFELIDGKLLERQMGAKASRVAMRVSGGLDAYAAAHGLGDVFNSECAYQCFPWATKKLVRKPDFSFVAQGRLPDGKPPDGNMPIHPDLAAEVVSPNDLADEIEGRRMDFMRAGTRLFWVIYPKTRTVHVFRQGGTAAFLDEDGELSGEDVVPGFTCKVAALFAGL